VRTIAGLLRNPRREPPG